MNIKLDTLGEALDVMTATQLRTAYLRLANAVLAGNRETRDIFDMDSTNEANRATAHSTKWSDHVVDQQVQRVIRESSDARREEMAKVTWVD
jgi:hypothetical protein